MIREPGFDAAAARDLELDTYREVGWLCENPRTGEPEFDKAAAGKALFDLFINEANANSEAEKDRKARTKPELYSELVPNGPGARTAANTPEETAVAASITNTLWGLVGTGQSSWLQSQLGRGSSLFDSPSHAPEGFGLVVLEAKVRRTRRSTERPGVVTNELVPGRFVSGNHALILKYGADRETAKLLRTVRSINAMLAEIADRQPDLAVTMAKRVQVGVKQAIGQLTYGDPKAVDALVAAHKENGGALLDDADDQDDDELE